jgi:hypothetical protein
VHSRRSVVNLLCQCRAILGLPTEWCERGWVDKISRRPSMTSPRRFVAPATPFPSKSPSVPFCKHSGSCLFPGAWNAAGSGRSNPAREKQKRGSRCPRCPQALHRSSQLQLKDAVAPPGARSLAAMRTPPSCGRGRSAEERQSLKAVVGERRGSVVG